MHRLTTNYAYRALQYWGFFRFLPINRKTKLGQLYSVISTGRCNTGVKSISRRLKVQGLPGPLIQFPRDPVQFPL
jgi:hypothetical protein